MRIRVFIPLLLMCFSCKDYLDLIPKNEQVVANIDDVRTELLTFWAAHVSANGGNLACHNSFLRDVDAVSSDIQ